MKAQYKRITDVQAAAISDLTRKPTVPVKRHRRGRGSGFLTALPGIIVFCVVLLAIF